MPKLSDTRVRYEPLPTPAQLIKEYPLDEAAETVGNARQEICDIISGASEKRLIIVGPCSIHDTELAKDYAKLLMDLQQEVKDVLLLVMRAYFEKPRTTVGWKGLINDPHLDGTYDIRNGLAQARKLLVDLAKMGIPTATEALDPDSIQFFADTISYASIGARTTEAQKFREMVSALSMPVGYKNGTHGGIQIAADALVASAKEQAFLGPNPKTGKLSVVFGKGNPYAHIILRGGDKPNFDQESVSQALTLLRKKELLDRIVIDCSHGNSGKDAAKQGAVFRDVLYQMEKNPSIIGMMLESHIYEGKQSDKTRPLAYGISITDACIGFDETTTLILEAAKSRRALKTSATGI